MAILQAKPTIIMDVTLRINEYEIRALQAITVYGLEALMQNIKPFLPADDFKKHKPGLETFFKGVSDLAQPMINNVEKARYVFTHPEEAPAGSQKHEQIQPPVQL